MIAPPVTPREQIAKALEQAGEAGLKVDELVTVTGRSNYVVLYTLRNMKDAGQVEIKEGGEKYQRDRLWVLVINWVPKALGRPSGERGPTLAEQNSEFRRLLRTVHPSGYEDARLLPRARLVGNQVA
jgi:hypothetical protein